jgi:hypothetical protein
VTRPAGASPAAPFLRGLAALGGLGLVSLLGLLPLLGPALDHMAAQPGAPALPRPALAALLLVQPALLVLALTASGLALAPGAGLRSLIADAARGGPVRAASGAATLRLLAVTTLLAAAVLAADVALVRAFPASFPGVPHAGELGIAARIGALFYGGVVEELMLRLGAMTLLVRAGMRLAPGLHARRPGLVAWPAIALAALLFGLAHLPAMAGVAPLSGPVVARTVGLNLLLGLLYGWAYWRMALEYAMLSHAWTHGVFGALGAVLALLPPPAAPVL